MDRNGLDALYISSFDENISEYVPMSDCHRFYVTEFTGSVAEVLIIKNKKIRLYVDGRYYLQADKETNPDYIDVIKCNFEMSLEEVLKKDVQKFNIKKIGLEGNRCTHLLEESFKAITEVIAFDQNEIKSLLESKGFKSQKIVHSLPLELSGETTKSKLNRIIKENEAIFLQELDSISWLTNLRGYHHPYNSTFIAIAICLEKKIHIFTDEINLEESINERTELCFHSIRDFNIIAKGILKNHNLNCIYYDKLKISAAHLRTLQKIFGSSKCLNLEKGILPFQAIKNKIEVAQMKKSFDKSSNAIYSTIKTITEKCLTEEVSEKYLYDLTNENYKKEGAKSLSFNTIAAFGENSALVHFGNSSEKKIIQESEFALLDSGGFYDAGLATDCTRTFAPKGNPTPKMKEIYTLVLKSLLSAQAAVFKSGILGSHIDKIARKPLIESGYNYLHGTGHGVGINVHEGHYSLRPESTTPLVEGLVGSIEPGIYIEGHGGVRLENIVTVVKHPFLPGMLRFEPILFLGFMPELIHLNMLSPEENIWLNQYEDECTKRGFSFR